MIPDSLNRYLIDNYDFHLPKELIRQVPPSSREDSRLMRLDGNQISDLKITDLLHILEKGDLLILNRTLVRRALVYGTKTTGGKIRITLIEKRPEGFIGFISGSVKDGEMLRIGDKKVTVRSDSDHKRVFEGDIDWEYVEKIGHLPLPPYIKSKEDFPYYQNEIGNTVGSIAAPTASLHFSNELIAKLNDKGVNVAFILLSVGYGTFKHFEDRDIRKHVVDEEEISVDDYVVGSIENAKGKIVGVGTTVVRALETASYSGVLRPYDGITGLFIYPGHKFNSGLTHLVTNFHIPKSSLLSLTYAFGGEDRVKDAYEVAIGRRYYFFSLGDAMMMDRMD